MHLVTERGVEIFVHPSENNLESLRKCRGRPIFDGAGAVGPGPRDRSDSRGSVHNRKELREAAYAAIYIHLTHYSSGNYTGLASHP